jgi:hypothetical protein
MSVGQFNLQSALYTALNVTALTDTLSCAIVDEPTANQSYPFVAIGDDRADDYSTKDLDGADYQLNLDVWSQYKGSKECKQIMDKIHDLLHDSNISVSGFNLINMRLEYSDILRDPDGVTRHGVMRFRAIILGS